MKNNDDSKKHCLLCEQVILAYHPDFNRMQIDDTHAADICSTCIHKFMQWQREKLATLFPTKALKKFRST